MEPTGFLNSPHQNNNNVLQIISWNINGAKTKLEKMHVYNFLSNYDIVSLNEVKTPMYISMPGYVSFKSNLVSGVASRRGGTVVMVRNYLSQQVYNVDSSMTDQVWFQLRCVPDVMFGFCYVPPTDSSYFTHESFVNLHEKMTDFRGNSKFCIIGDLNARFGASVRNIPLRCSIPGLDECIYPNIPDNVNSPNDNAYFLSTLCSDNGLVMLNNLKTATSHFPSQKTFKRRNQWISELDTAVVSYKLLNYINRFNVHQTDWLPSDHAPISIELKLPEFSMDYLLLRAGYLGGHGSLMGQAAQERMVNRSIRYHQINLEDFSNTINNMPIPNPPYNDVNLLAFEISESLYRCVNSCSINNTMNNNVNVRVPCCCTCRYRSRCTQYQ